MSSINRVIATLFANINRILGANTKIGDLFGTPVDEETVTTVHVAERTSLYKACVFDVDEDMDVWYSATSVQVVEGQPTNSFFDKLVMIETLVYEDRCSFRDKETKRFVSLKKVFGNKAETAKKHLLEIHAQETKDREEDVELEKDMQAMHDLGYEMGGLHHSLDQVREYTFENPVNGNEEVHTSLIEFRQAMKAYSMPFEEDELMVSRHWSAGDRADSRWEMWERMFDKWEREFEHGDSRKAAFVLKSLYNSRELDACGLLDEDEFFHDEEFALFRSFKTSENTYMTCTGEEWGEELVMHESPKVRHETLECTGDIDGNLAFLMGKEPEEVEKTIRVVKRTRDQAQIWDEYQMAHLDDERERNKEVKYGDGRDMAFALGQMRLMKGLAWTNMMMEELKACKSMMQVMDVRDKWMRKAWNKQAMVDGRSVYTVKDGRSGNIRAVLACEGEGRDRTWYRYELTDDGFELVGQVGEQWTKWIAAEFKKQWKDRRIKAMYVASTKPVYWMPLCDARIPWDLWCRMIASYMVWTKTKKANLANAAGWGWCQNVEAKDRSGATLSKRVIAKGPWGLSTMNVLREDPEKWGQLVNEVGKAIA